MSDAIGKKKLVILSGAGMSAESGIDTFRDSGGLWEGHNIMAVASPEGWKKDQNLVLDFYNKRRRQLKEVSPNLGHKSLADAEEYFDVSIVTQNVDDLHERAGSKRVIHLHGELRKAQSTLHSELVYPWLDDLNLGDTCEKGAQLRPFIVWFNEEVPMISFAMKEMQTADIIIVVGTSLQVYPAAGLVSCATYNASIYYLDPTPNLDNEISDMENITVIKSTAAKGLPKLIADIMRKELN